MSKQEVYAWISLVTTLALLILYTVMAFGVPENLETYADALQGLLLKVVGLALLIRLVLSIFRHTTFGRVDKDERDRLIQLKGYRNAYFVAIVAIVTVAWNELVGDFFSEMANLETIFSTPYIAVHSLVITLFIASAVEYVTQLFYYRTGSLA